MIKTERRPAGEKDFQERAHNLSNENRTQLLTVKPFWEFQWYTEDKWSSFDKKSRSYLNNRFHGDGCCILRTSTTVYTTEWYRKEKEGLKKRNTKTYG